MNRFKADFWEARYANDETGWDAKAPTTPFVAFFETLKNKEVRILIPGCGNAYEGELLWRLGFKNTYLLDYAEAPRENFLTRVPSFPANQFLLGDFFELKGKYDFIFEQTFFCALEPKLRSDYAKKMYDLLEPNGHLVGLMFTFPLTEVGPPFGGSAKEYQTYFEPYFDFCTFEPCRNSIKPRMGKELFINLKKKQ